jgi:hypothetical protein
VVEDRLYLFDKARRDAGLSHGEFFLRYFELGGMSTVVEVEAYLCAALQPSPHEHDVIAHALNERFVELGGNHPVPYSTDSPTPETGPKAGPDAEREALKSK